MSLVFSAITPHPPIIIPEIGKNELKRVQKTCAALELLNTKIVQAQPDTIILISPHAPMFPDFFAVSSTNIFSGDFQQFGDLKNYFEFKGNQKIIDSISQEMSAASLPCQLISNTNLDHGALVPLYYLAKNLKNIKIVLLSFSMLSLKTHYKFGQILKKVINQSSEKIVVIASGDLSHRLTQDAPAGFHPDGKKFDEKLIKLLREKNNKEILNLDPQFIENAGECGLRSIVILLGTLNKLNYQPEILSYEGPFGVGYLAANFKF